MQEQTMTTKTKKKIETLLDQKRREYGIPEYDSYPGTDNIVLWRLPPFEMTAGGIVIPEDARSPSVRGVIISAGPQALEKMDRAGYRLGHTVVFKRFAGWEHEERLPAQERTPEHKRICTILHILFTDILSSDDLAKDVKAGRTRFVKDSTTGQYFIEQKKLPYELAEDKATKRREKLRLLAGQTASPKEAAVAKRLLEKEE